VTPLRPATTGAEVPRALDGMSGQFQDFADRLRGVRRCGDGFNAHWPGPHHKNGDKSRSLTFRPGKDAAVVACDSSRSTFVRREGSRAG
jgi:hypothetical protein